MSTLFLFEDVTGNKEYIFWPYGPMPVKVNFFSLLDLDSTQITLYISFVNFLYFALFFCKVC